MIENKRYSPTHRNPHIFKYGSGWGQGPGEPYGCGEDGDGAGRGKLGYRTKRRHDVMMLFNPCWNDLRAVVVYAHVFKGRP